MKTPSPYRDSAVPSLFTEAQIQGAYMFACQELFQEFVQRNGVKSDPNIPDAISISSIDVSKD